MGVYPPGSVFKPLTALAAIQEHIISPYTSLPCTGVYYAPEDRSHHAFHNWDPNVNQQMNLTTALAYSCDTYFYRLGNDFYQLPKDRKQPLQKWAELFGFGSVTGTDAGPESAGLVPDIPWRRRTYTPANDPCCWQVDRLWKPGNSIQLAIGQGDLLVTPLQMTRFYAALANGGTLVTPHLLTRRREHERDDRAGAAVPGSAAGARRRQRAPRGQARALAGDAHADRHLLRRLRQLPGLDRRQDRHRGEGRHAARLHTASRTSPGGAATVRRRRPRSSPSAS